MILTVGLLELARYSSLSGGATSASAADAPSGAAAATIVTKAADSISPESISWGFAPNPTGAGGPRPQFLK